MQTGRSRVKGHAAELEANAVVNLGGHYLQGRAMGGAVGRAVGARDVTAFNWLPVYLAAPFVTMLRELIEMRYLWKVPLRLDNSALIALLGKEPHTDLDQAAATCVAAVRPPRPEKSVGARQG